MNSGPTAEQPSRGNLTARKSLGQHFLRSASALRQIISAANIKPAEKILEIGPGEGVLTEALLASGASVTAIEKDSRAVALLKARFDSALRSGQLKILEQDFLTANLEDFGLNDGGYAVIANIPYYITGAILEKSLEEEPRPNRLVLLVQKEVGERIMARNGKESLLSIAVKIFGRPSLIAKVPRGAFQPPPQVDSVILSISEVSGDKLKQAGLSPEKFFSVLKAGFAHKRKLLRRNLEAVWPSTRINKLWVTLNLDQNLRAEDLAMETWLTLASQGNH